MAVGIKLTGLANEESTNHNWMFKHSRYPSFRKGLEPSVRYKDFFNVFPKMAFVVVELTMIHIPEPFRKRNVQRMFLAHSLITLITVLRDGREEMTVCDCRY